MPTARVRTVYTVSPLRIPPRPKRRPPLPVRESQLRAFEGELTVHPTGVAVSYEGRVHAFEEMGLFVGLVTHQAGDELRAVLVEEQDGLVEILHQLQRDFGGLLPFPLMAQRGFGGGFGLSLHDVPLGSANGDFAFKKSSGDRGFVAFDDMQLEGLSQSLTGDLEPFEQGGDEVFCAVTRNATGVEGVADLAIEGVFHRPLEGRD